MDCPGNPENASLRRWYRSLRTSSPFNTHLSTLLKAGFLCDVYLKVEETVIPVHRVILASISNYFKELFENEALIDNTLDLTLQIEDADILKIIVKYIYQGEVTLNSSSVFMLLNALSHIDIRYLKKHCEQFLFDRLRPIFLFPTWELAWRHSLHELTAVCFVLCRETLCNQVLRSKYIKYMSIEFIEFIIDSDLTIDFNSAVLMKLLINWLSHESSDRFPNVKQIVKKILWKRPLYEEQIIDIETFLFPYDDDLKKLVKDSMRSIMQENLYSPSKDLEPSEEIVKKSTESQSQEADEVFYEDQAACNEGTFSYKDMYFGESSCCINYVNPLTCSLNIGANKSLIKSKFTIEYLCTQDSLLEENPLSEELQQQPIDTRKFSDPNWSIIIQESENQVIALYCSISENWYSSNMPRSIKNTIGFLNGEIVCRHDRSGIMIYNLKLMNWRILQPPYLAVAAEEEFVPCLDNSQAIFFTCSGSLYSACALRHRKKKGFRIIVNEWNLEENVWDCKISVRPNRREGFVMSVSLGVKTSTGTYIYLMASATIRRMKLTGESKKIASNKSNIKVSMKPNEIFYVYKINMKSLICEELGYRFSEPAHLENVPSIVLEDRIIFILDVYEAIEENFEMSFKTRSQFPLDTLVLYHEINLWRRVKLLLPLPPFYDMPVRRVDGKLYSAVCISFFKNFMLLGLHRTPHVYQIAIYDIARLQITVLSPVPLPAVGNMMMTAVDNHQPINKITNEYAKDVDLIPYHFNQWQLRNWYGIIDPTESHTPR
ncbi:uncharacterized protein LOC128251590 [Octopus bimaculoides]|uniref:BTB domain-containing protein n=1 Tax=Octopus bimaculoides TaxID=37653 RepID=A0A0L8HSN9_OCTBM|nr:uncharacterized protein LOC128251590 [Octopus bimaculoides]